MYMSIHACECMSPSLKNEYTHIRALSLPLVSANLASKRASFSFVVVVVVKRARSQNIIRTHDKMK